MKKHCTCLWTAWKFHTHKKLFLTSIWAKNAAHFYNSIKSERFSWVSTCFCSIRTLSFDVHINTKRRIQSIERKCCHQKSEACELMFWTQKDTLCRSIFGQKYQTIDGYFYKRMDSLLLICNTSIETWITLGTLKKIIWRFFVSEANEWVNECNFVVKRQFNC